MRLKTLAASMLLGMVTLSAPLVAMAQANIENGTVRIGVRDDGALMPSVSPNTGITYLPTDKDGLTPGCYCEAWGIADAISATSGYAGASVGTSGIVSESFTSTATTATSVSNAFGTFRVTHAFAPSSTPNIYEVKVTIENISAAPTQVLYGRAMDWDVFPTTFTEYTTLQRGTSTAIIYSSDDGFSTADPLASDSPILFSNQDVVDSGPTDHGAHFRFNFGTVAPGGSVSFTIGYGAAGNQVDALNALATFGAEAYSLGKPSENPVGTPNTDGTPNTFIFAFKGIGGVQLIGVNAEDDNPAAIDQPASGSVALTNLFDNDTADALLATASNVTLTQVGTWPVGITSALDGAITVASTAAAGTYALGYQICSTVQPTQCDIATLNVKINATTPGGGGTGGGGTAAPLPVPVDNPLMLGALGVLLAWVTRRKRS